MVSLNQLIHILNFSNIIETMVTNMVKNILIWIMSTDGAIFWKYIYLYVKQLSIEIVHLENNHSTPFMSIVQKDLDHSE